MEHREDNHACGDDAGLVECDICGMKIAHEVAAVMYLKGEERFFCSHECQDKWEHEHPVQLW